MAPLDVCLRARPQGLITVSASRVGRGSLSTMPGEVAGEGASTAGPPCTHTFGFLACTRRAGGPPPRPQRSATRIFANATFPTDFLLEEVASGQVTSHGPFPCRGRRRRGLGESSGASCCRPYYSITAALGWGRGRGAAGSGTSDPLCPFQIKMLLRPAPPFPPPPAPPRCPAPPKTCSPSRAKSLEISTAARDR